MTATRRAVSGLVDHDCGGRGGGEGGQVDMHSAWRKAGLALGGGGGEGGCRGGQGGWLRGAEGTRGGGREQSGRIY